VEGSLQLRVASESDAEAIMRVINDAFRKAEGFLFDRDRVDPQSVGDFLRKGKFLVAENDGRIAGCVYVELQGERSYLGLLSVDPALQKSGLGSKLMAAAEEYCANAGCRFMDLRIVNLRKELPAFYHRLGYVETGTSPLPAEVHSKQPCHFVNMSKPLA
jgi:N-acetylglutamate synthase-like GNAT family acetyltransferase